MEPAALQYRESQTICAISIFSERPANNIHEIDGCILLQYFNGSFMISLINFFIRSKLSSPKFYIFDDVDQSRLLLLAFFAC